MELQIQSNHHNDRLYTDILPLLVGCDTFGRSPAVKKNLQLKYADTNKHYYVIARNEAIPSLSDCCISICCFLKL
ncbi:hypothetical protein QUA82_17280 [Microcoleus sp. F8-D3]